MSVVQSLKFKLEAVFLCAFNMQHILLLVVKTRVLKPGDQRLIILFKHTLIIFMLLFPISKYFFRFREQFFKFQKYFFDFSFLSRGVACFFRLKEQFSGSGNNFSDFGLFLGSGQGKGG